PDTASPRTWVLDRIEGAKEFMAGEASEVSGIRVIDPYTIQITLAEPFAPFLRMLGMPAAHIVDRNEIEKYAAPRADCASRAVGTGRFEVVCVIPADRIPLAAQENYHCGRRYLDGIVYRVINGQAPLIAELEAGSLHSVGLSATDLPRFRSDP